MRTLPLMLALSLAFGGCNGEIYLRDGVTDGDTFYLADRALTDPDPVLQSWVRYSLGKSACQLGIGGDNPARATSFDCELTARRHLLDAWAQYRLADAALSDPYLDALSRVEAAGFLAEYVSHYHGRGAWQAPGHLDADAFSAWRRGNLRGHDPQTRLVGSWNYARNVGPPSPVDDRR